MICPKCNGETNVIDSRDHQERTVKRRRRKCQNCKYRFTTFEIRADLLSFTEEIVDDPDNH